MKRFRQRLTNRIKRTLKETYGRVYDIRSPEVLVEEELEKNIKPGRKRILLVGSMYDYADKSRGLSYGYFHFYHTLLNGDYSLIYFPQDRLKQKYGAQKMSQILRQSVYYYQPDFLIYHHYLDWINHALWREISNELPTKTIIILGDDYVRHEETRPIWELFNVIVTMDPYAYNKRKIEGFTNVFLSQWGFNHFLYRNLNLPRIYDVTFVGQCYGERPALIKELKNKGIDIVPFGRGWPNSKRLSQGDLIKVYNQSKITFNSYFSSKDTIALNGRDFEALGCGSFVVTQEIEEIKEYFIPGKEIVTYRDIDDAAKKIKYYLEHNKEREAIERAGHERALRDHTYEKRFNEIFAFADKIKK